MQDNSSQSGTLIKEWLKYAYNDELNAQSILTHRDGHPNGPCFLSQQMAEKHLKALLVFHRKRVPKLHDLLELETLLIILEPKIKKLHEDLVTLNRYYITTRYPGDFPEFSWKDAKHAYESALRVKDFVLREIVRD